MRIESSEKDVILIVDDNLTNLELLSDFLGEVGFQVWVARNGNTAIQKATDIPPDLILLDVMMPGMDGFETCRQLKKNPSTQDIPVIFMTALTDTVDKVKGLNLGAVDYMTKPFVEEEVLARVKLHLRLHSLTQTTKAQNEQLKQEISERVAAEAALQQLTLELEQRVEERTATLKKVLYDLQQTQVQLVQREKLSMIGQLVAGVAHEINNPIGFLAGNHNHTAEGVKALLEHIKLYQQYYPEPVQPIQEHAEKIDLDFLSEDLPNMIASMKVGIERIFNISLSLRNFSRSDVKSKVPVNIHEGIDSTLLILKYRLKGERDHPPIEVVKEYGELPLVECYPGQINQVFMNILANAIDALAEGLEARENASQGSIFNVQIPTPTIRICTEVIEDKLVLIRIADNGAGLTEEATQRLFEPMFTTKPVGHGTGWGLSISRQIVEEKHGGQLRCVSTPGQGAEFIIELPLV